MDVFAYLDSPELKQQKLSRWLDGERPDVLALLFVSDESPLYDFDYHRFSAWKRIALPMAAEDPAHVERPRAAMQR